jgi:hypothetical protein
MDKIEYHAIIKLFVKEGLTPNEIHSKFMKVYGASSPSFSIIKKWAESLNVAVPALKVIYMKDVQKVQPHQKSLNNRTIWYWMTGR